jgi:hypothetical protein
MARKVSSKSVRESEKQEAIERLREWLKPGDRIYTILRHASRSGMQREISLKAFDAQACEVHYPCNGSGDDCRPKQSMLHLDGNVALALGDRIGSHDGVIVGGCGMDMGAHLVYELGATLWGDGFGCIGEHCPSNEHRNGDRDYTPHTCSGIGYFVQQHDRFNTDGETPHRNAGVACHWHKDGGYALSARWL